MSDLRLTKQSRYWLANVWKTSQRMLTDLKMTNQWSSVTMLSQRKITAGCWSLYHWSLTYGNDRWIWKNPTFPVFIWWSNDRKERADRGMDFSLREESPGVTRSERWKRRETECLRAQEKAIACWNTIDYTSGGKRRRVSTPWATEIELLAFFRLSVYQPS